MHAAARHHHHSSLAAGNPWRRPAVHLPAAAAARHRSVRHGASAAAAPPPPPPPQRPSFFERVFNVRSSSSGSSSSSTSSSMHSSSASSLTASSSPASLVKHPITGDGSCMFRACVQGHHFAQHGATLPPTQEYEAALQLRRDVVQALRDNRDEMEPFLPGIADDFDAYLATMSKPGVWGGEPELLMASRVLKRPIAVYQPAWPGPPQHIVTYGEDMLKDAEAMHLLWSGAHYDVLLPRPISRL